MCLERSNSDVTDEQPDDAADRARRDTGGAAPAQRPPRPVEIGGPRGPEPTRYGDWERNGRCFDF